MIQLLSVADMRESDKRTIANGIPSKELMFRAGEAIFNNIKTLPSPIAIVCGNGNNAGDGYVLASLLKNAGIACTIFRITDRFSEDGKYYYNQCMKLNIEDVMLLGSSELCKLENNYPTIVDCIFGTGFHGEVKEPERKVIECINQSSAYIVSIDINSGLNGDSGLCDISVHSNLTLSVGSPKPGHYLAMAKDVCREVKNCDIGIIPINECHKIYLTESEDLKDILYSRPNHSNKGSYGYIGLIGGSQCYSGAIRLANMAASAMRSGAGVVKVCAPASLGSVLMPSILESTFYPLSAQNEQLVFNENEFAGLLNLSAIAFGMGIGNTDEVKKALTYLLHNYNGTLIIDADGLNALSQMDKNILLNANCQVVLSPHPKEFSRLIDLEVSDVLCKPIKLASDFAAQYGVTILLKGASTIISDGQKTFITDTGCPGMATAGSGDVLSGILVAICGYNKNDAFMATVASAYINGLAGEIAAKKYGNISMIASDTATSIAEAILSIN